MIVYQDAYTTIDKEWTDEEKKLSKDVLLDKKHIETLIDKKTTVRGIFILLIEQYNGRIPIVTLYYDPPTEIGDHLKETMCLDNFLTIVSYNIEVFYSIVLFGRLQETSSKRC